MVFDFSAIQNFWRGRNEIEKILSSRILFYATFFMRLERLFEKTLFRLKIKHHRFCNLNTSIFGSVLANIQSLQVYTRKYFQSLFFSAIHKLRR